MGLLGFIKDAGLKLFKGTESDEEKAKKVLDHLNSFSLDTKHLTITVANNVVHIAGAVSTIFQKIRVVATAGNVDGIEGVNDDKLYVGELVQIDVNPDKQFHTVASGESLSLIAKKYYGKPQLYNLIFEANQPMLKHVDKIYPGQVLVIPDEH
jgi:nucleoid-associated protein YgaU